jgi:putative ABC transport system permease protein
MGTLWQDIRYGFRMLGRNPGFTAVMMVILAVGIGANTALFSVVNAVLLRPLPYEGPGRIVIPCEKDKEGTEWRAGVREFRFLREHSRAFESVAASRGCRLYVTGIDRPHEAVALAVSANLFPLLGIRPLLGRSFLPAEEQVGSGRAVVLSHAFWADHLGQDPEVIGKTMTLDGNPYTVVGIMPSGFAFPFGRPTAFWVPLVLDKDVYGVDVVARLKKDVTLAQARAEGAVLAEGLREMDPKAQAGHTIGIERLLDRMLKGNRRLLALLFGAAGFVLLIACSNVANLFLARATGRQREMATRVALGASRGQVVRQMLTESLLVSVGAGLLGLLLTVMTVQGLIRLCPADIPRLHETGVDGLVLLFTIGASVLTGLIFGVFPAWRASEVRVSETLKEGGGRSTAGGRWRRLHDALVVSQMGLSLVLLVGAALLIRSLMALQTVDLGFQPENVLTLRIELPQAKYPEQHHCRAFFQPLLERVRALSHVRSAALVRDGLDWGTEGAFIEVLLDDRPAPGPGEQRIAKHMVVGAGYFEAMGIRLLKGRTFTDQDIQRATTGGITSGGTVIDENLARKYFPEVDPIGRRIYGTPIVGVVSTVKDFEVLAPTHDTLYLPLSANRYSQDMELVVRTDGPPQQLATALGAQVAALDKDLAISRLQTLDATLAGMLAPRRFTMILLSLFAGVALALAAVGVYGLLQYSAAQQTHDIGIRMALGARSVDVLRSVVAQGLKLALLGTGLGLLGALALTRVVASLLYDVSPTDPVTFVVVSFVLITVALLASYLPARRAARIDPMVALRCE